MSANQVTYGDCWRTRSARVKIRAAAHEKFSAFNPLDLKQKRSGQSELKILVSVVRFRPGPPYIHRSRKTAVFSFVLVQTFALCVRKNNLRSPHFSNTLFNFA
jgi:hypothetical protein